MAVKTYGGWEEKTHQIFEKLLQEVDSYVCM